ncbi:hypothetical protein FRC09_005642 [Ceratobasidium sp. 395]|nr:hypothetical protein FRC09_005642 [Ceratobasidium sp. 395]
MLRVRRDAIFDALTWLKTHNQKYYGDIVIDQDRLNALPPDGGVPDAIKAGIRHETNELMVNDEYHGYVPETYYSDNADIEGVSHAEGNPEEDLDDGPDVIPLQCLGVMDNDLSQVSPDEFMQWGLHNMQRRAEGSQAECGYAVRHGAAPVSTFGQPPRGQGPADPGRLNLWAVAFPLLYPYGVGGIEDDRPVRISLNDHARWSLQYHDRRFRYHHSFIFCVFGEQQKRQGLLSAKIEMNKHHFDNVAQTLSTITPADLRHAAEEENRGDKTSNPAIQVLKRSVTATSCRVMASGPSRTQLRSQIYSAAIYFNQPTVWLTINPDDLHDPIAQIFACEEIDMDNFINTAGPDRVRRSQNIARDPYAAAKFFHFTITLVIEKLFGITSSRTHIHSRNGVLGRVKAYFGTVECQGRGTLHLHMLLWLHNVPPPRRLKELLRTPEFQSKVSAYLRANVRSFRPGLTNKAEVDRTPANTAVAYSRLPNPALPIQQFAAQLEELETSVVRAKQVHECDFGKCQRLDKAGRVICKRGAPWKLSEKDSVEEDGTYHTKRSYQYINGYCPAIAHVLKCNQDIQLLLHGNETLQIAYYISKYMTKAEGRTHNIASLLSDNLTRHFSEDPTTKDLFRRQQDLIFRAVNVLNRQQEISAPLAVLHIMGFHEVYRSHQPETIYWGSFLSYIYRTFDELNTKKLTEQNISPHHGADLSSAVPSNLESAPNESDTDAQHDNSRERVVLEFNDRGAIYKRSQVDDYIHRGTFASSYNMLDYFVDTYEQIARPQPQEFAASQDHQSSNPPGNAQGRPPHTRVPYMDSHPRSRTHVRVVRPDTHNHMPNIIGLWFPRKHDQTQADIYAACILVFLKAWRHPEDIKKSDQTWADALNDFLATASERVLDVIDNLEHRNESQAAAESKQQELFEPEEETHTGEGMETDDQDPESDPSQLQCLPTHLITQEMLNKAELEMENYREVVHGLQAVQIGQRSGVFGAPQMPVQTCNIRASQSDMGGLKSWLKLLKQSADTADASYSSTNTLPANPNDLGTVEPLLLDHNAQNCYISQNEILSAMPSQPSDSTANEVLFPDQQRAFGILRRHLAETRNAQDNNQLHRPPQLRMLLVGEGGTGKSRVIQTISREFKRLGVEDQLMKAAFTARIVVGRKDDVISNASKHELTKFWKPVEYIIIDEYSMLSKEFLAQLSRHISIAKLGRSSTAGDLPFGGINIILCGDAHQIPPVAVAAGGALYHPATSSRYITSPEAGLGRKIYESFGAVVILKQQVRVTDPVWQRFLSNFRVGQVQESDINLLDSVTLTNPHCRETDFTLDKWRDCSMEQQVGRGALSAHWTSITSR